MRISALAASLAIATPVVAQTHDMGDTRHMGGMAMPGMTMPPAPRKPAPKRMGTRPKPRPATPVACPPEHAAMGHCTTVPAAVAQAMPGMAMPAAPAPCPPEHAAMGHCTPAVAPMAAMPGMAAATPAGTDQVAGDAPPPAPPTTLAAARFYDPAAMATANRTMRAEHGGMTFHQIIFNLAEVQVRRGRDGYRWDGEGWYGGDIHRAVVKTEGEGSFGERVAAAEVQALYARALDPYWNLQAGVRQDLGTGAKRSYATIGIEGLAPYWFDVEGALFLSDRGDVLARAEAWYDQRVTQRAVLQPRVELNLAAQDVAASRIGAGLSTAELGLRLRYEIAREFAPYLGLSWERRYGATARYARADGEDVGSLAFALGIRTWF